MSTRPHLFRSSADLSREWRDAQQRKAGSAGRHWCGECGLPESNAAAHPDSLAQQTTEMLAEARTVDLRRLGERDDERQATA